MRKPFPRLRLWRAKSEARALAERNCEYSHSQENPTVNYFHNMEFTSKQNCTPLNLERYTLSIDNNIKQLKPINSIQNTGGTGMSRIGRMPIAVPAGVTVDIAENNKVTVKGPKGTLERVLPVEMDIKLEGSEVIVTRPSDLKKMKSLHGLTRTLISNMVIGVTDGYAKVLEINGVGYKVAKAGKKLTLSLGYSHPVEMEDPEGLESVVEGNKITIKGIDKEKVGQYAAEIRDKRRPEPYKGKGIKYADEVIRRKVGKTGKK